MLNYHFYKQDFPVQLGIHSNFLILKCQPHKMVKHTQTIR